MTFTKSQTCYICGCTPKHANDIDKVLKLSTKPEHFKFGLSTLHAWIRFFECLLHVSYRLDFKTWQVIIIISIILIYTLCELNFKENIN